MTATRLGKSQGPALLNAMTKALAPTNHILKRQTGLLISLAKSNKVSAENAMEAKKMAKKDVKNEEKQTSLLKKLASKGFGKGKGGLGSFLGDHWGKLLLGGGLLAALFGGGGDLLNTIKNTSLGQALSDVGALIGIGAVGWLAGPGAAIIAAIIYKLLRNNDPHELIQTGKLSERFKFKGGKPRPRPVPIDPMKQQEQNRKSWKNQQAWEENELKKQQDREKKQKIKQAQAEEKANRAKRQRTMQALEEEWKQTQKNKAKMGIRRYINKPPLKHKTFKSTFGASGEYPGTKPLPKASVTLGEAYEAPDKPVKKPVPPKSKGKGFWKNESRQARFRAFRAASSQFFGYIGHPVVRTLVREGFFLGYAAFEYWATTEHGKQKIAEWAEEWGLSKDEILADLKKRLVRPIKSFTVNEQKKHDELWNKNVRDSMTPEQAEQLLKDPRVDPSMVPERFRPKTGIQKIWKSVKEKLGGIGSYWDSRSVDMKKIASATAGKESAGAGGYQAENTLGFLGKYQMGVGALEDVGLIKPGTTKKSGTNKEKLANKNNWKAGWSKQKFLQDEKMQEQAQEDYMLLQAGYLKKHVNELTKDDNAWGKASVDAKRSMLAMSHISGAKNAAKIHYGHKPTKDRDAYGTKYTDYTRDVLKNAGFDPSNVVINGNAILLSGNNGTAAKLLQAKALDKAQTNVTQVNVTPTQGGGTNKSAAVPISPTPASDSNKDRLINKVDK